MEIRILETSEEVKKREEREKVLCPECGSSIIFGSVTTEVKGIFRIKHTEIRNYDCANCKCRFEVRTQI